MRLEMDTMSSWSSPWAKRGLPYYDKAPWNSARGKLFGGVYQIVDMKSMYGSAR